MRFGFKAGVLDVLDKELEAGVPKGRLARKIGVASCTLFRTLNGYGMSVATTAKFIRYFQKYHGWSKDEWKEKVVELYERGRF